MLPQALSRRLLIGQRPMAYVHYAVSEMRDQERAAANHRLSILIRLALRAWGCGTGHADES